MESSLLLFVGNSQNAWQGKLRKKTALHLHVQGRRRMKERKKQVGLQLELTGENMGKMEPTVLTKQHLHAVSC